MLNHENQEKKFRNCYAKKQKRTFKMIIYSFLFRHLVIKKQLCPNYRRGGGGGGAEDRKYRIQVSNLLVLCRRLFHSRFYHRWANNEMEKMSPWDFEPINETRLNADGTPAIIDATPVTKQEFQSMLYAPSDEDWFPNGQDYECRRLISGIDQLLEIKKLATNFGYGSCDAQLSLVQCSWVHVGKSIFVSPRFTFR